MLGKTANKRDVYRCISLEPGKEDKRGEMLATTAIVSCLNGDNDIRRKCEATIASGKDVMEILPVSSLDSNNVYRNIYCAQCNNDSFNISIWTVSISCNTTLNPISSTKTKEDVVLLLSTKVGQEKTGCTMKFLKPPLATVRDCSWRQPSLISTCNINGKWENYDADIQKACALYESAFYSEYKNIFCFLCNTGGINSIYDLVLLTKNLDNIVPIGKLTYRALINFEDSTTSSARVLRQETRCPQFKVYVQITGECQDMLCSEGKYLTSSGECKSRITSNMMGYRVCVMFDVSTDTAIDVRDVESVLEWNPTGSGIVDLFGGNLNQFSSIPSILELVLALNYWCPNSTRMSVHLQARISKEGLLEDLEQEVENAISMYRRHLEKYFRSVGKNVTHLNYTFLDVCPNISSIKHTCQLDRKIIEPKKNYRTYSFFESDRKIKDNVYFIYFNELIKCSYIELSRNLFRDKGESVVEFTPTKKDMSSRNVYRPPSIILFYLSKCSFEKNASEVSCGLILIFKLFQFIFFLDKMLKGIKQ